MYYMGVNAGAWDYVVGYIGEKFLGVGVWIEVFYVVRCYSSILLRTYLEILV
jgi:hypothetical protein